MAVVAGSFALRIGTHTGRTAKADLLAAVVRVDAQVHDRDPVDQGRTHGPHQRPVLLPVAGGNDPGSCRQRVLAKPPLAVALLTLHIEWMVQRHYIDSVKDDRVLDPQFKNLLKFHWMEEVQHAKLDTLMVHSLAAGRDEASIAEAIAGYAKIGAFLDEGLQQQTEFDLESFEGATGRRLNSIERERFLEHQLQANRWTYLGSGMTHPNVLATLEALKPGTAAAVEEMAQAFC